MFWGGHAPPPTLTTEVVADAEAEAEAEVEDVLFDTNSSVPWNRIRELLPTEVSRMEEVVVVAMVIQARAILRINAVSAIQRNANNQALSRTIAYSHTNHGDGGGYDTR